MNKRDLRSAVWIIPYLTGMVIISYLGAFGGLNIIPFGWDFAIFAVFSICILYLAVWSRAALTSEEVSDYLISESAALAGK